MAHENEALELELRTNGQNSLPSTPFESHAIEHAHVGRFTKPTMQSFIVLPSHILYLGAVYLAANVMSLLIRGFNDNRKRRESK